MGFVFAVISGAAMSVQGVMNTRLGDKIGLYESNMYVQGTAFILSLIVMWLFGKGNISAITGVNKLYLHGYAGGRQAKSYARHIHYIDISAHYRRAY